MGLHGDDYLLTEDFHETEWRDDDDDFYVYDFVTGGVQR